MAMTAEQLAALQKSAQANKTKIQATAQANANMHNTPAMPSATPAVTPKVNTPMSATATKTPSPSAGYTPPAYGSNVAGFDANNANHKALADAGQSWAKAKASGDTAGMSAAAALGDSLRAQSGVPTAYDSKAGVTQFGMPQEVKAQAAPVSMPQAHNPVTSVRSGAELQQQSGDSLAIERAALKNAIDTQMASLRNNAQYANQLTNDSRALSDFSRTQSVNPFANMGKKSFDEGLIGRQRSIDDSSRNSELQTKMNSLDTEMANFDKLSPERQRTIYNELLALERQFGLNLADRTGEIGGQRTLAGIASDRAGQQQDFNQGQQEWENRFNYGQATGTFGNGQQTLQKAQQDWSQAFAEGQFNFDKAQTAWDNNFKDKSFQQSMNEAAASRGLQWASLGQRDKEFIADQAFREKSFNYQKEQDKIKNSPASQTAEEYYKYIDSSPSAFTKDIYGLPSQNNQVIETMILDSGLSDAEITKLYRRYGIPIPE